MPPSIQTLMLERMPQGFSPELAEGVTATDQELSGMNFYVEGITAPMPQ